MSTQEHFPYYYSAKFALIASYKESENFHFKIMTCNCVLGNVQCSRCLCNLVGTDLSNQFRGPMYMDRCTRLSKSYPVMRMTLIKV